MNNLPVRTQATAKNDGFPNPSAIFENKASLKTKPYLFKKSYQKANSYLKQ